MYMYMYMYMYTIRLGTCTSLVHPVILKLYFIDPYFKSILCIYRIAGNFCIVQNFAFFVDSSAAAKIYNLITTKNVLAYVS